MLNETNNISIIYVFVVVKKNKLMGAKNIILHVNVKTVMVNLKLFKIGVKFDYIML